MISIDSIENLTHSYAEHVGYSGERLEARKPLALLDVNHVASGEHCSVSERSLAKLSFLPVGPQNFAQRGAIFD